MSTEKTRVIPIYTKARMYDLLQRGCFGNIAPQWNNLDQAIAAAATYGPDSLISLRSRQITNPLKMYHVPYAELKAKVAALPQHQTQAGLVYSLAPPDHRRTIQGELSRTIHGLTFTYTTVGLPMRLALLQECIVLRGTQALMKLQSSIPPADVDRLMEILDTYGVPTDDPFVFPRYDTVIEFSAFDVPFGTIPNSNVIVWEVRNY